MKIRNHPGSTALPSTPRRLRRVVWVALAMVGGALATWSTPATADDGGPNQGADVVPTTTVSSDELDEPTDPTGLGTEPTLDLLAQSCFDGDLEACDDLYWQSDVGSAYEDYGSTCGGRVIDEHFGGCAEEFGPTVGDAAAGPQLPAPTQEPTGLGTDAELDLLAEECHDGAMLSCDELYARGDDGSDYRTYGDTCAGRQSPGTGDYCHELLGFPAPTQQIDTLPADDAAMFRLAGYCQLGDMSACDDLYREVVSTPDSPFKAFADTCAGRQEEGSGQFCESAFPEWEQLRDTSASATTTTAGELGAPTDPSTLGNDATFDGLAQSCFGGDLDACDTLYWQTPVGSPYETYGSTCGGRIAEELDGGCVDEFGDVATDVTMPVSDLPAPTAQPSGLGTDSSLDQLAQECYDGAMFACDKLFVLSEQGSDYETFADTCAGRQAAQTGKYCHELAGFPAPTASLQSLPSDDVALHDLAVYCSIGDMGACDELYRQTPTDSPFHAYADTCAGRQAEGTNQYCTSAFPQWEDLRVSAGDTVTPASGDEAPPTTE